MTRGIATSACLAAALCAGTAAAQPAAVRAPLDDPDSILTFQVENDAASTLRGTSDQYYTSGLRLGYVSPTGRVPEFIGGLGRAVWGDGVQRVSLDLSQSLFTPRNTQTANPDPRDRPYAGILAATLGLVQDTANTRSVLALSLGVVGPAALGHETQNGFHSIINDTPNLGWSTQIQDEPALELLAERTWRVPLASLRGFEVDALPVLTAGLGNVRIYGQAGVSVRFGQGLDSDFGAPRIRPGLSGSDAYTPTRPFAWYVFAGADGQAVGHDITLDGNTWRHSRSVERKPWVGELEAGLAVMLYGVRVTYTQTWQTQEFRTQRSGLFNFGSLAASVRF